MFEGECFWVSDSEAEWTDARDACETLGAQLATVDSMEVHEFLAGGSSLSHTHTNTHMLGHCELITRDRQNP